ncbi:hypothetical protein [Salinicola tamaricis]|nr:hypothetical protein [Salinicola tamaricis]
MSVEVLKGMGYPSSNAINAVRTFRDFDNQLLKIPTPIATTPNS